MSQLTLQKATRKKSKMRLNISGPAGSGKTYSALLMAKGLVGAWDKIAVIDTEAGSASLYEHLGAFQTMDLDAPYSPERYIQAIDICIKAGIECVIIDSSTHEWNGPGGCVEANDKLAAVKYKGNSWAAWSETSPRHDMFVNKVLTSPIHIITCTRSKTETVMGDDKKVKKVGMKDMQREGWEYELTVSLNLDRDTHLAMVSKDRTELFEGKDPFVITEETGLKIRKWCELGVDVNNDIATGKNTTMHDKTNGFKPPAAGAENFYNIWQLQVDGLKNKAELLHLYNNFSKSIDADEKLKAMFKVKQDTFTTKTA